MNHQGTLSRAFKGLLVGALAAGVILSLDARAQAAPTPPEGRAPAAAAASPIVSPVTGATPRATLPPRPTPFPLPTPTWVPSTIASFAIETPATAPAGGGTFSVRLVQQVHKSSLGSQAELRFDPRLLEVVAVEPGPVYTKGSMFILGEGRALGDAALPEANQTGRLSIASMRAPGQGVALAGAQPFAVVTMRAKTEYVGTATLSLGKTVLVMAPDAGSKCIESYETIFASPVTVGVTGVAPLPSAWPAVPDDRRGGMDSPLQCSR